MQRERIASLLPVVLRPDQPGALAGPMGALLGVMEALHEPVETALVEFDHYVDPLRAPAPFVLMLAAWLDLDRYLHLQGARRASGLGTFPAGVHQLRRLVLEAAPLSRRRGTAEALVRMLELATGRTGFSVRSTARPFHFVLQAPPLTGALRELVMRIAEDERPAHATYELEFGAARAADDATSARSDHAQL